MVRNRKSEGEFQVNLFIINKIIKIKEMNFAAETYC